MAGMFDEHEIFTRTWMDGKTIIGDKDVKTCPFCGSPEVIDTDGVGINREWRYVHCNNCGAKGPAVKHMCAIDAWNTRR